MGEEAINWASALARAGQPPWLVLEYLIRELELKELSPSEI